MLVLTRRVGEEIVIGGNIRITVVAISGDRTRLGIAAPPSVRVDRLEIFEKRSRLRERGGKAAAALCPVEG
jgi:carbon storage regulator